MSGETLVARSAHFFSATPKASKSLFSQTTMTFGERLTERAQRLSA